MRHILRQAVRNPTFTLTVVLVLGLGVGATTAVFTIVHGVLLSPLPYDGPEQLVVMVGASYPELERWKTAPSLASVAVWDAGGANLTDQERSERVLVASITTEFFDVFRVVPQLGRPLTADDEIQASGNVVFLSYGFWRRRFAGSEAVVGHLIHLNGLPFTVVGVMPRGFSFPGRTELWVPSLRAGRLLTLGMDAPRDMPTAFRTNMIARLLDGVSVEQARMELNYLNDKLREKYRGTNRGISDGIAVYPLRKFYVEEYRTALLVLLAAVGLLLLIACLNAVSLLLARALTRQKEAAIRLCLGATPRRIVVQAVGESVFLAFMAGVAGVLLAHWLLAVFKFMGPADMPRLADVELNQVALGFALCVCVVVGFAVGLAPARRTVTRDLTRALSIGGTRATGGLRQRARRTLLVCELALTLALAAAAGLTLRSLFHLLDVQPGFRSENIVTLKVSLPQTWATRGPGSSAMSSAVEPPPQAGVPQDGLRTQEHDPARLAKRRETTSWRLVLNEVGRVPGLLVGAVGELPLSGRRGGYSVKLPDGRYRTVLTEYAEGDYFQVMGIPLLAGRLFMKQDSAQAEKVMLVNERLASQVWGGLNAVGEHLLVEGEVSPRTVVGVVGNVKVSSLTERDRPQIYLPAAQPFRGGNAPQDFVVVVRTPSSPEAMVTVIRDRVVGARHGIAVYQERTMEQVIADATASPRFRGILLASFATAALTLALIGVYGVVSFSVAQRTHEIGVRLSLGAQRRDILRMILGEALRLGVAGVLLGVALALAFNRYLSSLLFGIGPSDPIVLGGVAIFILLTSALACLPTALRACRLDPAQTLRYE